MIDADVDDVVQELRSYFLDFLDFLDVFNNFLEMLLFWSHSKCLKEILVDQWMHFHAFLCEYISFKEIVAAFPGIGRRYGRKE